MSAIAERVAAEHAWVRQPDGQYKECRCGVLLAMLPMDDPLAWHVAEMTEAATRAQITADIEAARPSETYGTQVGIVWLAGYYSGLNRAARIAAGGVS